MRRAVAPFLFAVFWAAATDASFALRGVLAAHASAGSALAAFGVAAAVVACPLLVLALLASAISARLRGVASDLASAPSGGRRPRSTRRGDLHGRGRSRCASLGDAWTIACRGHERPLCRNASGRDRAGGGGRCSRGDSAPAVGGSSSDRARGALSATAAAHARHRGAGRLCAGLDLAGTAATAETRAWSLGSLLVASEPPPPRALFLYVDDWRSGIHYQARALIDGRFKFVRDLSSGAEQVFDLETDPGEFKNLRRARQDVRNRLSMWLDAWDPGVDFR